jgi:hypothetical protein
VDPDLDLDADLDPDPSIFVINLKDAKKKLGILFKVFLLRYIYIIKKKVKKKSQQ